MQPKWIVIGAALAGALPGVLAAQRTPRPPRPAREPRTYAYSMSDHHGRIGVIVNTEPDSQTDKIGAKLDAVTPGTPAAKAGLKVGDIITKFNSTSLAGARSEADEESGPGAKLVELARKLEPGDTVQLEYRRGGDSKKATLVAEELSASFRIEMPKIAMTMPRVAPGMPEMPEMPGMEGWALSFGSPWGDLELVNLNPDLGEYFGTKDGVLVVKAPSDSSLPVRSGDVILSIGGRKPSSPSHAMRIFHSYEPGETVSIDLMRKQKRMTVAWKVPTREERTLMRHHEREDQSAYRALLRRARRLQQV
ncbi:MAG TPA: PDZ domain-containing protein [Gemmatimonadales bacterium]|nr:PDZ domain-containing protein [Gemmatimonadales bacterium]